jgi:hypothetical protein
MLSAPLLTLLQHVLAHPFLGIDSMLKLLRCSCRYSFGMSFTRRSDPFLMDQQHFNMFDASGRCEYVGA